MRRFQLVRDVDVSGVSGTGHVCDGVQFASGTVVIHWNGEHPSVVVWNSLDDAMAVHGHHGTTRVEWIDG